MLLLPFLLTLHLVSVRPDAVMRIGEYPHELAPEEALWIWNDAGCTPLRVSGTLPAAVPCGTGIERRIDIAAPHDHVTYLVRWGTEEMLREIPDELLPAQAARAGEQTTLRVPAGRVFARVDGPHAAGGWQELGAGTTLAVEPGMRAGVRVTVAEDRTTPEHCTAHITTVEVPQPRKLAFLATCDVRGMLMLPNLPSAPTYRIRVTSPGLLPRTVVTPLAQFATLELHRGAVVRGRLLDEAHHPLSAAVHTRFLLDGEWVTQRTAASPSGTFSLSGMAGAAELSAFRDEYVPAVQRISAENGEVLELGDVILQRAGSLTVRVTATDGRPIPRARLRARGTKASTNEQGLATLSGVPRTSTDVQVSAEGYLPVHTRLAPREDRAPAAVRLERAAGIRFHAVNARHEPAGPGSVVLESGAGTRSETLSESGAFEALDLPPGAYSLEIHAAELAPVRLGPKDVRAGDTLDLGTIELAGGSAITGTVIDAESNASIAGAHVMAMPGKDYGPAFALLRDDLRETTSTAGGRFRLAGLAPGTYSLAFDAPHYARTIRESIKLDAETDTKAGEIGLSPARLLVVHCTPVQACGGEARLLVGGAGQQWAGIAAPVDEGLARLTPVPAGTFPLRLSGETGVLYQQDVTVAGTSDTTEVTVDLRQATIDGTVVCNGRAVSGGTVVLQRDIPDRLVTVNRITDLGTSFPQNVTPFARQLVAPVQENGTFTLPEVAPGAYLSSYHRDGSTSPPQPVVVPRIDTFAMKLTVAGANAAGTVFDEAGHPAGAAHVALFHDAQQLASTMTAPDGTFTFIGLPPGNLTVRAERERSTAQAAVLLPQETPVTLVLRGAGPGH